MAGFEVFTVDCLRLREQREKEQNRDSIHFRPGYIIKDQNASHFLTFTVCGWIDLFTRKLYKDILVDSFKYCQKEKGLILNAYVIMSNHLHLIAMAAEGFSLSDIIRDFKKFTHHKMIQIIESGQRPGRT